MIKPAMGGGGKGMKVCHSSRGLPELLRSSREEALASCGDTRLILEKFIARSRHVEVQIFGDNHGNLVHLHQRDCSVQRRHQKVASEFLITARRIAGRLLPFHADRLLRKRPHRHSRMKKEVV